MFIAPRYCSVCQILNVCETSDSFGVGDLVHGVVMSFSCCFLLGGERIIRGSWADDATIARAAYAARCDCFEFLCL